MTPHGAALLTLRYEQRDLEVPFEPRPASPTIVGSSALHGPTVWLTAVYAGDIPAGNQALLGGSNLLGPEENASNNGRKQETAPTGGTPPSHYHSPITYVT